MNLNHAATGLITKGAKGFRVLSITEIEGNVVSLEGRIFHNQIRVVWEGDF